MNLEQVKAKNYQYKLDILQKIQKIKEELYNQNRIDAEIKEKFILKLDKPLKYSDYLDFKFLYLESNDSTLENDTDKSLDDLEAWNEQINEMVLDIYRFYKNQNKYNNYLDSAPVYFEGDIIITDPCYIIKEFDRSTQPKWSDYHTYSSISEYPDYDPVTKISKLFDENARKLSDAQILWSESNVDDWVKCEYGDNLEILGINTYLCRDTLYGDWSCTTYDIDKNEVLGEFCADAGLVAVFLLDEVLKYNPYFDYHINRKHTTTWIKNFKGTIQFIIEEIDENIFEVQVKGSGINTITNEPIDFITHQTGL